MAKYSLDPIEANCYPGTTVLINKLGIMDDSILAEAEADITQQRILLWEKRPRNFAFDFEHYKEIHNYLFNELYDWAGQIRNVNISKKGTQFCNHVGIEQRARLIFARLEKMRQLKELRKEKFVAEFVDLYVSTNELHPFREGNGRTQRVFLSQLAANAGWQLDFSRIDVDELMIATIQSAQGVADNLKRIFNENIKKPSILEELNKSKAESRERYNTQTRGHRPAKGELER